LVGESVGFFLDADNTLRRDPEAVPSKAMLFVILMSPVPLKIDFTSLHFHPFRSQQYKAEYERRACKTESCLSLSCSIEHPLFSAKPTISQHGWLCWTGGPMLFQGFIAQRGWSAVTALGCQQLGPGKFVTLKYDFDFIWAAWVIRSVAKCKASRTMPMLF